MSNSLIIQVDDDDHFLLQETLGEVGSSAELKRVCSCGELMNLLEGSNDQSVDVILLDVNLSPDNVPNCLKRLNVHETVLQIPVETFSIGVYLDEIEEAYRNGTACFIRKPFSIDKLKCLAKNLSTDVVRSLELRKS